MTSKNVPKFRLGQPVQGRVSGPYWNMSIVWVYRLSGPEHDHTSSCINIQKGVHFTVDYFTSDLVPVPDRLEPEPIAVLYMQAEVLKRTSYLPDVCSDVELLSMENGETWEILPEGWKQNIEVTIEALASELHRLRCALYGDRVLVPKAPMPKFR